MSVRTEKWALMPDGRPVFMFELENKNGLSAKVINFGGIITSIKTPDRNGILGDITLGYDSLSQYMTDNAFMGAMIGRYANRIKGAEFSLGGKKYRLTKNEGENQLHGGGGFHKKLWDWRISGDELVLSLFSPDGEDGFPGNLYLSASLTLDDSNRLEINFMAKSDKDTVINLTNHAYFNLACSGDVKGHILSINADYYNPVDKELIPTGELREVAGTDFDFRRPRRIEKDLYDHNYALRSNNAGNADVEVYEPHSGRKMRLYTNMPGLQFYCGGGLSERRGKNASRYGRASGFCLEPQYFPNSPNESAFPSCLLKEGNVYNHKIVFEFTIA